MTYPIYRYPLDPTGENPNNSIIGEVHELSQRPNRVLVPTHGPVFVDNFVIYDNVTNTRLIRGNDYAFIGLMQEATLKFGKGIVSGVLITNKDVSSQVRINYQALGGYYTNKSNLIYQLYEDVLNDERPVDWANILNKPTAYLPALHQHLLMDVVGFESVVNSLERIRDAITMTNVPAFERIIDMILSLYAEPATREDLLYEINPDRYITVGNLKYALELFNFNTVFLSPITAEVSRGNSIDFKIACTNLDNLVDLYWTIEHVNTTDDVFKSLGGKIDLAYGQGEFTIDTTKNYDVTWQLIFKINIRKTSMDGPIIKSSFNYYIKPTAMMDVFALYRACCPMEPTVSVNATSMFVINH